MGGISAGATRQSAPVTTIDVELGPLGLSDAEVEALERLVVALGVHGGGGEPDVAEVLRLLDDDLVADVFATEVVANALVTPTELGRFVALLVERSPAPHPSLMLLSARLAEWNGQAQMGERFVDCGLALEPGSPSLLLDAAWYAADRGDADSAMASLRAAGVPDTEPEIAALVPFVGAPVRGVAGRQARCRCGSGRPARRCCGTAAGLPPSRRAGWLHARAMTFARRPPQHPALVAAAAAVAGVEPTSDALDRLAEAAASALVANLVLFEGGAMASFVQHRRPLLPAAEAALARRWVGCRHAVPVGSDDGRLTDPASGVTTRDPVPAVHDGDVVVGVLVPVEGRHHSVLDGWCPVERADLEGRPLDAHVIGTAVRRRG